MQADDLLSLIEDIENEKVANKKSPTNATIMEVQRKIEGDMLPALAALQKAGKIYIGHTLNGHYVKRIIQ